MGKAVNVITGEVTDVTEGPWQTEAEIAAARRAAQGLTKLQLAIMAQRPAYGFMTAAEAEAWLGPGTIPPVAQGVLNGIADAAARSEATLRFVGATSFARLDPFILLLQSELDLSDATLDAFFTEGAAL